MKQYIHRPAVYRPANRKKKRLNPVLVYKIILVLAFSIIIVWMLYKDDFKGLGVFSGNGTEQEVKPTASTRGGPPDIAVSLDGRVYIVPATKDPAGTDAENGAHQAIGLGKNSKLEITFDKPPELLNTILYKNELAVLSTQRPVILADEIPGDGEYKGVCEVSWSQGSGFKGTAVYSFTLLADFPSSLSVSATEIDPGELLVICAENLNTDETLEVTTDFDFKPNVFPYGNKRVILLPVSYYNKPGKIYGVRVKTGEQENSFAIKLNEKEFVTQYMTIDTKIAASTRNEESSQEIDNKLDPLKPVSDPEPYWSGNFIMPVEGGRVTETDFGKRRYVNNAPTSYRHNGLDIGQDTGTPVMASNDGRVLIADSLIETGNTVVIEHGFGLKTWYYHMNELSVKTGDWVKQGDIIGKVGSTGFSTAPHLHFAATVNNVFINPITLVNEGVPLINRD